MSASEKALYIILAFVVGAAVAYLFYGGIGKDEYNNPTLLTYILDFSVMAIAGLAASKLFLPIRKEQIIEARRKKLRKPFRMRE